MKAGDVLPFRPRPLDVVEHVRALYARYHRRARFRKRRELSRGLNAALNALDLAEQTGSPARWYWRRRAARIAAEMGELS